jgi:uncharacterized protein (DUF362 family)
MNRREPLTNSDAVRISRRQALAGASVLALGGGIAGSAAWWKAHERGRRAEVFIADAPTYDADLVKIINAGLAEIGVTRGGVHGKRILLKPNLVETALGHQHINTHPAVVVAAAEAFRRLDAGSIVIAEGQGHRRDSLLVLEESGMEAALRKAQLEFVDLNHDTPERVKNAGHWTKLPALYLPRTVLAADWIVSLPKLKTHHWAGMTCAMKNFFGVMPGLVYGWPKNVLHWAGIPESILDINAAVKPSLAIVDAIVGMEGDGPIMGTPKQVGCLVMGRNLPAVDATCARLMGLRAEGVKYLSGAAGTLGPIREANIAQRGEQIERFRSRFEVLDLPHLRGLTDT